MTSWKLVDLKTRWDALNDTLDRLGENLGVDAAGLPDISGQSSDVEFRMLVASLRAMKSQIVDLGKDIGDQADLLSHEIKHYYDLARDYDAEIDIFRKGREQAFSLYDSLSQEHKVLLTEFETLKHDHKLLMGQYDQSKSSLMYAESELNQLRTSYETVVEELSNLKVELMGCKKRIELLEEENEKLSAVKDHESSDRNELIEQLSKEIKSRNDALVLAEAARNELSRTLGEAEEDRRLRERAEQDRDEAVGSVEALNELIEQLKAQVEEGEKLYKHEIVMRHKIEENLLEAEDKTKELTVELESVSAARDEALKLSESSIEEKTKMLEEKDALASQIATIASQLAKDKQDSDKLMETLKQVQEESEVAKQTASDSVEKAKQMERVVNQLISEKGELEGLVVKSKQELDQVIADNKDVVNMRINLENKIKSLESELAETSQLFNGEKKMKEEAFVAQQSAEKALENAQKELVKVKEAEAGIVSERDELKMNLESVQKVLQSERQSRSQIEKSHSALSDELVIVRGKFQDESRMREDLVKSLDAETRSKNEIIKQLEEVKKTSERLNSVSEKAKSECDSLREKVKDLERVNKDLGKELDGLKKDVAKASTETEKAVRQKEEMQRKFDVENAQSKENEKGWNSEKSEHEKTYKAYYDEKGRAEKFERELEALKGKSKQSESLYEAEKIEHGKTYKAFEAEKEARSKLESEIGGLKAQVGELNGTIKSLTGEKQSAEKRMQKMEEQLTSLREKGNVDVVRKQLDDERTNLENQIASLRKQKSDAETASDTMRSELDKAKIKANNLEVENKQLLKRLEKFAAELAEEQRIKNELLAATKTATAAAVGETSPSSTNQRRSSLDNIFGGSMSPLHRLNRALSGSSTK